MPKTENSGQATVYALSLKQPWAALLASGRKTIEVRNWPTVRRGRILIHAALVSDERAEGWQLVPADLRSLAQLTGGILAAADLIDCVTYRSRDAFAVDQDKHLNDPEWFKGRVLYGFTFAHATILPFRPYTGWMRFFPVESEG